MLAAVIVTYNRKNLLAENIEMLLKQSRYIDKIFVIDNCSTDGTYEFLCNKGWMASEQFKYIRTGSNIGGAGGFYTGTKAAYEAGADWIILMDDDGRPCNEHTIGLLVDHAEAKSADNTADGKLFINSLVVCGDRLTSKIDGMSLIEEAEEAADNGLLIGSAHPFNGTLISRKLIEVIGYPNKEFFVKGDEVDYKQRTFDAGGYVVTLVNSKYYHPYVPTTEKKLFKWVVPVCVEVPWKEYYNARNFTYTYKKKRRYKMIAFEIVFVKLYAIFTMKCPGGRWNTIKYLFWGLKDGWRGNLGANVRP